MKSSSAAGRHSSLGTESGTLDCGSLLPLWLASLGERGGLIWKFLMENSSASFGTESGSKRPQSREANAGTACGG